MTDEKKKMTAQGSSVGADDGQSISQITENSIPTSGQKSNDEIVNSQDSLEEMYRKIQRMTDPRYLHTLTMTELFQTTYKSRPPVVEGLLYAGAYILAGAPKIGKSFLVAQIAYHVSTGQDLWGYKVHQGTVLYLALEDDFQRIQSRMFMMYGVNDTPNLHFATAAGKIGNGLDEQLKNFVQEHPDTNLIIIDTIKKFYTENPNHYFLTGKTKPTEPRTYRQFFSRFLKRNGLQKVKFHEIRHTFAVRAIEIPEFDIKSLSEILGHKNVSFTLNVYGSANLQQKVKCMNLLNDLL